MIPGFPYHCHPARSSCQQVFLPPFAAPSPLRDVVVPNTGTGQMPGKSSQMRSPPAGHSVSLPGPSERCASRKRHPVPLLPRCLEGGTHTLLAQSRRSSLLLPGGGGVWVQTPTASGISQGLSFRIEVSQRQEFDLRAGSQPSQCRHLNYKEGAATATPSGVAFPHPARY